MIPPVLDKLVHVSYLHFKASPGTNNKVKENLDRYTAQFRSN